MIFIRFILRFVLVPLGISVAALVDAVVVCFANWTQFAKIVVHDPQAPDNLILAVIIIGPAVAIIMAVASVVMLMTGLLGVLISEAFALRSWIFHAGNGALSSWIGWATSAEFRKPYEFFEDPTIVVGAGIVAGFAYWAVAGWSAGFWKPVFSPPPSPPPTAAPA